MPHYNLQELSLADCDIGAENLAHLLNKLPRLRMLDLKGVRNVKSSPAIEALCGMEYVSELHVQNVGLQDEQLQLIAKSFGTRLEILDVKSNSLSDKSVQALLDYCFRPPEYYSTSPGDHSSFSSGRSGIHSLAISNNWNITPSAALQLLQTGRIRVLDIGHINIPGNAFFPTEIYPSLEATCRTVTKLRIDFRIICATIVDNSVILPQWKPSAFPCLETLVLEGLPYYIPKDYQLIPQLKELLVDIYSYEKTHPSPQLKSLILEIAADEDSTWVPEDGSSVFPRFPSHIQPLNDGPPSFAEAEEDEDDGGWSHVTDYGEGGVLEEYEGQDFSFFNEPYMKVPELAAATSPRSPGSKRTRPRKFSNAAPITKHVPKDSGLVDVAKGVERVLGELRRERKLWNGKVVFAKWQNDNELGTFL